MLFQLFHVFILPTHTHPIPCHEWSTLINSRRPQSSKVKVSETFDYFSSSRNWNYPKSAFASRAAVLVPQILLLRHRPVECPSLDDLLIVWWADYRYALWWVFAGSEIHSFCTSYSRRARHSYCCQGASWSCSLCSCSCWAKFPF